MRNGSLDLARLPAAFGVVLFHAHAPGGLIGYSGLAYFLILVPTLGLPSSAAARAVDFARNRFRRLLLPWVIWSAIFAVLEVARWLATERPSAERFDPLMLVTGTSLHLWFLPYAFVASLCLPPIRRLALTLSHPAFIILLTVVLLLLLISFAPILHGSSKPPLAQWAYGLPSLLTGLVLGLALLRRVSSTPVNLAVLAVLGTAVAIGWAAEILQLTVAFLVILVCMALPIPSSPLSAFCSRHSMGVYLVHPLCISALDRALPLEPHGLPMAILVLLASLGLSVLLGHFRTTQLLIGDMAGHRLTPHNRPA